MNKKVKKAIIIVLVTLICILYLLVTYMVGVWTMRKLPPKIYNYTKTEADALVAADPQVLQTYEGDGYTVYLCEDNVTKVTGWSPYDAGKRLYVTSPEDKIYIHTQRPCVYDVVSVDHENNHVTLQSSKIGLFYDITWGDAAFYMMLIVGIGLFNNLILVDKHRQEKGEFE